MLLCVIDAMENRDVATTDIPCDLLQTDMESAAWVRLDRVITSFLLKISPEKYRDKVINERGKKVKYTNPKYALYRTLIISLLFCGYLVRKIKSWGFQQNPYGPCIMNKIIYRNS